MGNETSYVSVFSEELEDLEDQNLRIIARAALFEEALQMMQKDEELSAPADKQKLQKFLHRAERIQQKDWLIGGLKTFYHAASKVAVVLLILVVGSVAAAINVEAIRVPFLNWLIEVQETHTSIHFVPQTDDLPTIEFGYLPEGYELGAVDENDFFCIYHLTNDSNQDITVIQNNISAGISLDTEEANVSNITFKNGKSAFVVEKDGIIQVVLQIGNYIFQIKSTESPDEIIKIAEYIKLSK